MSNETNEMLARATGSHNDWDDRYPSADKILTNAAQHMQERAASYDKPDGERSIGATVKAFNAITGDGLMNTEERGWLFMSLLKDVRSQQGEYKADNYDDKAAYSALQGESAARERG